MAIDQQALKTAAARETAPPGWEESLVAMKAHPEIDNPYALAWWMHGQGDTPHHKETGKPYDLGAINRRFKFAQKQNALRDSDQEQDVPANARAQQEVGNPYHDNLGRFAAASDEAIGAASSEFYGSVSKAFTGLKQGGKLSSAVADVEKGFGRASRMAAGAPSIGDKIKYAGRGIEKVAGEYGVVGKAKSLGSLAADAAPGLATAAGLGIAGFAAGRYEKSHPNQGIVSRALTHAVQGASIGAITGNPIGIAAGAVIGGIAGAMGSVAKENRAKVLAKSAATKAKHQKECNSSTALGALMRPGTKKVQESDRTLREDGNFDEQKHPRGEHGRWEHVLTALSKVVGAAAEESLKALSDSFVKAKPARESGDFDEEKHPRASDGKFTSSGGGESSSEKSSSSDKPEKTTGSSEAKSPKDSSWGQAIHLFKTVAAGDIIYAIAMGAMAPEGMFASYVAREIAGSLTFTAGTAVVDHLVEVANSHGESFGHLVHRFGNMVVKKVHGALTAKGLHADAIMKVLHVVGKTAQAALYGHVKMKQAKAKQAQRESGMGETLMAGLRHDLSVLSNAQLDALQNRALKRLREAGSTPKQVVSRLIARAAFEELERRPNALKVLREHGMPESAGMKFVTSFREADPSTGPVADTIDVLLISEGFGNKTDGNYYPPHVLQEAVQGGVFNGLRCFIDHPTPTEERELPERRSLKLCGYYSDVQVKNVDGLASVVGKLHFSKNTSGEEAKKLIETDREFRRLNPGKTFVAFSIDALGPSHFDVLQDHQCNVVDSLVKVLSTDLVTIAGRGGRAL